MRIKTTLLQKGEVQNFCIQGGIFLMMLCMVPFILQSLLFMVGITVTPILFPFILVSLCIYHGWFWLKQRMSIGVIIGWYLVLASLIIFAYVACIRIYDFSYDGMWYHQDAVRLLAQGWNPYNHVVSLEEAGRSDLFVNYYPKAIWTTESMIYAATNKLESAKMVSWLLLFASFFLAIVTLRKVCLLNKFWSVMGAVMLAFNPVVMYQLFSFYIDGMISSLILCLFLLLLLWKNGYVSRSSFLLLATLLVIFLINTKFTALVYVCIFGFVFFVYEWLMYRWKAIQTGVFIGLVIVTGVLLFGYPTYVTNTMHKGHPFYPVMGEGNVGADIINIPLPADFKDKNRFEQFWMATFARPVWSRAPDKSRPKPLFTIEGITTYDGFKRADPEMSGFGPLFAEVICMVLLGIVLLILFNRKVFTLSLLMGLTGILLSIICIPSFWYARYTPQIWMMVCLFILLLFQSKRTVWLGYIMVVVQVVNILMVVQQNYITQLKRTTVLNSFFNDLKERKNVPVIYEGWTGSFKMKLKENNVEYIVPQRAYAEDSIIYIPEVEMTGAYVVK